MNRVNLYEDDLPEYWYNILPDLPKPLSPPIDPETKEPMDPRKLEMIFPKELIAQEMAQDRWIPIPEEVRQVYALWRPTPLIRARKLEEALGTPAKIYYKYEGVSPTGSHKPNTAVAQAYYNVKTGAKRLTTETGAGQWGSALSFAGRMFDLKVTVYMVKASYHQKPHRKTLMKLWGAEVYPSPSEHTRFGRSILEKDPESPGSLGIAISEAIEDAATHEDTNYSLGSVLNHVLLHQTVIGQEAIRQFEILDEYPDIIFGCVGGGSSFAGTIYPFYYHKKAGKAPKPTRFVAVEPKACPTLTKGLYMYDHGDTARLTPLLKMYTLGHDYVPPPIHAGGLRYHGDAPTLCLMVKEGEVGAIAYDQVEVFSAAKLFVETEGIVPAPESAHAIKATVDEALKAKEKGSDITIFFLLSGHGYFDMKAYEDYLEGKLESYTYPETRVRKSIERIMETYPWLKGL